MRLITTFRTLMAALLIAGPLTAFSNPRVLPVEQASHFCRLFVNDGQGRVYPLSIYASHLTTLLCGRPDYHGLTAEQVFTSLIFYFDDWHDESPIVRADYERLTLLSELHSGQTLRIFPHEADGTITWYAPTDEIPASVGDEHRRYMRDVMQRLNAEVQAGRWKTVDAYIDRMIEYQCQYGGSSEASKGNTAGRIAIATLCLLLLVAIGVRIKKAVAMGQKTVPCPPWPK